MLNTRISKFSTIWITLSCLGLLFLFSLFFTLFVFTSSNKVREIPKMRTYQYQELSFSSNDVSNFGLVTLNKELHDDEFISFHSKNGNQIIISNFAPSQFKCEGRCSCQSEKGNRRSFSSPSLLSRPLFLIISAISASLAFIIAEKSFHDQCLLQFSSSCDEENIRSSVTSCSEKEEEETTEEQKEEEFAEYSCRGYCIPKIQSKPQIRHTQKNFLLEIGGCETLTTTGNIRLKRSIGDTRIGWNINKKGEKKSYSNKYADLNMKAKSQFSVDYLNPFCKEMSKKDYIWISPTNPKSKKRRTGSMCVGGGTPKDFPDERLSYWLKNVECVLTSQNKHSGITKT